MDGPVGRIGAPIDDRGWESFGAKGCVFHLERRLAEPLAGTGGTIPLLMGDYGRRPVRIAGLEDRVRAALSEDVEVVGYDPAWPDLFEREEAHLRASLPPELLGRIEHFGSTAVPGLAAKPVVDVLVEVASLEATKARIAPLLEAQGYDYFWRPAMFDGPPYYAWFIKRDAGGRRTHHLHMVEARFEHWDRLLFRDHLIAHPDAAAAYQALKTTLAAEHPGDREAYTKGKAAFVERVTAEARRTQR